MPENAVDGRRVEGGPAQPVYVVNQTLPAPAGGGGGPATIANGADVALGATTDPAIVSDGNGTVIGFVRGMITLLGEIENIIITRTPSTLGAKTRANSFAVALATDATAANAPEFKVNVAGTQVTAGADGATFATKVPVLMQMSNGVTADVARAITTMKTNQGSAIASGSDLTLWTPAASKKFRLRTLHASASVSGRYEARDGTGTVIAYFRLAANVWTQVALMDSNGALSTTANNALIIRNQSGSPADIDATASGSEE